MPWGDVGRVSTARGKKSFRPPLRRSPYKSISFSKCRATGGQREIEVRLQGKRSMCLFFSFFLPALPVFREGIYRRAGICCIVLLCLDRPPHVVATQPSPRGPEPENIHRARSPAQSIPSRANWLSSCKRKRISTFSFADDI